VESEDPTRRLDGWPPSHPSPPVPPPREYGSPGVDHDRHWVWAVLGGVVAIAIFAGGGVWLLSGSGEEEPAAAEPTSAAPSEPESAPASPSSTPVAASPPAAPARCWDGAEAPTVAECSLPEGAAGLAWLFPQVAGQQCRPPKPAGAGVVLRLLCSTKLPDGTKVQLGYYQWESVPAADAYYDAQALDRADGSGFHGWSAKIGERTKAAVLYADAPYSRTLVYRTASGGSAELQHIQPRPPDQVRGEPGA